MHFYTYAAVTHFNSFVTKIRSEAVITVKLRMDVLLLFLSLIKTAFHYYEKDSAISSFKSDKVSLKENQTFKNQECQVVKISV